MRTKHMWAAILVLVSLMVTATSAAAQGGDDRLSEAKVYLDIPSTVPDDVETGFLETLERAYRWIRVTESGERPLPERGRLIGGPLGVIAEQEQDMLLSADGVEWRPWTFDDNDVAYHSLWRSGGDYWLLHDDLLWRSADGVDWQLLTPKGIDPGWPSGLPRGRIGAEQIVTVGDTTLIQLSADGNFPEHLLKLGRCTERPVPTDREGVYRWMHDENCRGHGPVRRFVPTETGMLVVDDDTGGELTHIDGLTLDYVDDMAQTDELHLVSFVAVENDEVRYHDSPWPRTVPVFATDDEFLVLSEELDEPVWTSSDGAEWASTTLAELPSEAPWGGGGLVLPLGSVAVAQFWSDGEEATHILSSSDGITWQGPPIDMPPETTPIRTESGWFASEYSDFYGPVPSGALWMHVGDGWVSLDELGIECPDVAERRELDVRSVGATTFVFGGPCTAAADFPREQEGARTLWIIQPEIGGV